MNVDRVPKLRAAPPGAAAGSCPARDPCRRLQIHDPHVPSCVRPSDFRDFARVYRSSHIASNKIYGVKKYIISGVPNCFYAILDLPLALPKELGGKGGATNPKQFFAAGYAACFENAVIRVTRKQTDRVHHDAIEVIAEVGLVEASR